MNTPSRAVGWAFSLGAHALLLGGVLLLARAAAPNAHVAPQSCRVSLAQAVPSSGRPDARQAPAEAQSTAPPLPKQARQDAPQPPVPSVARTEPGKISPRKREAAPVHRPTAPAARTEPTARPAKPAPPDSSPGGLPAGPAGSGGPQPRLFGGLSAYEYSALDQRPSITRRIEPEYPAKARRMSVQGAVVVQLVVDASGQPRNCTVVRATPDGFFEEAALAAVRRMRFAPGKIRGQAVNTVVRLPFSFRLQ